MNECRSNFVNMIASGRMRRTLVEVCLVGKELTHKDFINLKDKQYNRRFYINNILYKQFYINNITRRFYILAVLKKYEKMYTKALTLSMATVS